MDHYKLCRLSRAAYEGTESVHHEMVGKYNQPDGLTKSFNDNKTDTTAYVTINDHKREAAIVFRGSDSWKDVLVNIKFIKLKTPLNRMLHSGFLDAYITVADYINQFVENNVPKGYKLYVTGHSLGGALATIHALRTLRQPDSVVTFGQPRVSGNRASEGPLYDNVIRYVYGADAIARMPKIGYRHGGELRYITMGNSGDVLINPSWWTMFMDRWRWLLPINRIKHHRIESYCKAFEKGSF